LSSVILWGPPGTGKTTLAEVVALSTNRAFERLSAVTSGVKDVREAIERATERLGQHGRATIVFVDEIHRFSTSQQDALLPSVESGIITLIGATTENPYFEVNAPLRSRSTLFRLQPLQTHDIRVLLDRGLHAEAMTASPEAIEKLTQLSGGDGRQSLTALEVACALARPHQVTIDHVESALGVSSLRYGRDDHYDVVSALIKSMRGSDVDAAVFWLARMLEAGDDPRFIARRMVIFASEDIGIADSQALVVAVAAAQAVDRVGMPEAQLNLSQCAIYLARAPKSNSSAQAIWNARRDVRDGVDVERRVQPGDISILVRTHGDAEPIVEALRARGIPVVKSNVGSVSQSEAVIQLRTLLSAMAAPNDSRRVKALALTWFVGYSFNDLLDDKKIIDLGLRCNEWAKQLLDLGIVGFYQTLRAEESAVASISLSIEAERRLTDLEHLAELLHSRTSGKKLSAASVLRYLEELASEDDESDELLRRIDSDAKAIQITTMHASKGLEYPIVLIPFP
jgi:putative ATPase